MHEGSISDTLLGIYHKVIQCAPFRSTYKRSLRVDDTFFLRQILPWLHFFGKETWDSSVDVVVAALIAICFGYILRSIVGSYDNEGVVICALLLTFYLFVKAVNTGSLAWAIASAFSYFYMVSTWGGYIFIINLAPLYVLVLLLTRRYSLRLYIAYNSMYILGMLLVIQIHFVGFQHVQLGEHIAAMGVVFLLQVHLHLELAWHLATYLLGLCYVRF